VINIREAAANLECLKQELIEIRSDCMKTWQKSLKLLNAQLGALILRVEQGDVRRTRNRRWTYSGKRNYAFHEKRD